MKAAMSTLHRLFTVLACVAALALAGCAGPRRVQSQVNSFSTLQALPQPATYRIELLPSQQARAQAFAPIEEQAQQALARVGLTRDDAHAQLVVQLGIEGSTVYPADWPYYGPWGGPRFGWGLGWGGRGHWHGGFGMGWSMRDTPPPLYRRRVTVVMRDAASQQVVFESSAAYEDAWAPNAPVYGVLFEQALRGFPQPPAGPRTERTELQPPE